MTSKRPAASRVMAPSITPFEHSDRSKAPELVTVSNLLSRPRDCGLPQSPLRRSRIGGPRGLREATSLGPDREIRVASVPSRRAAHDWEATAGPVGDPCVQPRERSAAKRQPTPSEEPSALEGFPGRCRNAKPK